MGYLYQALSLNSDVQPLFNDALQEQYNLFDIRYVVTPSGWSVPNFYKTLGDFGRHRLYQVETTGYFDLVGSDLAFAGAKSEFFPAASAWLKSGLVKAKQHPAVFLDNAPPDGALSDGRKVEPLSTAPQAFARISAVPGPARGRVISETVETGGYTADVEVLRDSLLMLKATYHPNWHATVDGVETPTVMLMPSYVGVPVAARPAPHPPGVPGRAAARHSDGRRPADPRSRRRRRMVSGKTQGTDTPTAAGSRARSGVR